MGLKLHKDNFAQATFLLESNITKKKQKKLYINNKKNKK